MGIVFQNNGTVGALEETKDGPQDIALKIRFSRCAKGAAKVEGNPECTGWADMGGVLADKADAGGRYAGLFEIVGDRADGTGTVWSDGHEKCGVDLIFLEKAGKLVA